MVLFLIVLLNAPGLMGGHVFAQGMVQVAPTQSAVQAVAPVAMPLNLSSDISALSGLQGSALNAPAAAFDLAATLSFQPSARPATIVARPLAPAGSVRILPGAPGLGSKETAVKRTFHRVSAAAQHLSQNVIEAIKNAGSIKQTSGEGAQGLGNKLQKLLQGESGRELSSAVEVPGGGFNAGLSPGGGAAGRLQAPPNAMQREMLAELGRVADIFLKHYAPIKWKKKQLDVDFAREYKKASDEIKDNPAITRQQFQNILADFVNSARDYHVAIRFYSTEKATLPLMILGAEGKYYIVDIDRKALPEAKFPFQVGDEVVEFDGKPVAQAADELKNAPNAPETDARFSEFWLTRRARAAGMAVPKGDLTLKIRAADGTIKDAKLKWKYAPEMVPTDVPITPGINPDAAGDFSDGYSARASGLADTFRHALRHLMGSMAHPYANLFSKLADDRMDNGFAIGGKKSFVPKLGDVVWEMPESIRNPQTGEPMDIPFKAYIYKDAKGRKIGYVRIPDYMADEVGPQAAASIFAQLMMKYQKETEGLVIDQVNNPGGSVSYVYALLSMLSDKPLTVPKHQVLIDEGDAYWAAQVIQQAQMKGSKDALKQVLEEEFAGSSMEEDAAMKAVVDYAQFILDELKAGRRLTNPVDFYGIGTISPQPKARYTKPIVFLINELDFSGGDFFPTILQDNKRATLLGVRTAGAGGAVKSVDEYPNQLGIQALHYTWTIATRNGKPVENDGNPIENLGVTPDVSYQLTAQDFKDGFTGYRDIVNRTMDGLVPEPVSTALQIRREYLPQIVASSRRPAAPKSKNK